MKERRCFGLTLACALLAACFCGGSALAAKPAEGAAAPAYDYTVCTAEGRVVETGVYHPSAGGAKEAFRLENGQSVTVTPKGEPRGFFIERGAGYEITFRVDPKATAFFRAAYSAPVPKTLFEHTSTTTAYIVSGGAPETGYVCLFAQNLSADPVTFTEISFGY